MSAEHQPQIVLPDSFYRTWAQLAANVARRREEKRQAEAAKQAAAPLQESAS